MTPTKSKLSGFSMIEILVTIVILIVGLLGLAGLQGRAFTTQLESYQRSQALILMKDMADRIEANRYNAAAYINDNPLGVDGACPGTATVAQTDLCDWHNALMGSAEGSTATAMIGARGCIFQESAGGAGAPATYQVVVSWQGLNRTAAPDTTTAASPGKCGEGDYKDRDGNVNETLHRAISIPVSVADIT